MNTRLLIPIVTLLSLTQCNKTPSGPAAGSAADAPASSGVNLVTEGASPHFQAVASKLDLGGASFTYSEEEATMKLLSSLFEEILAVVPAEETQLPAGFSVRKIMTLLGLDSVKASGSSSRALPGGLNHNRTFTFTPQGRRGLLSLAGGPAAPLLTRELATQGTDLAIEFPLHLSEFATQAWSTVMSMVPPEQQPMIEALAGQKQPPLGLSYREMAEKIDLRIALLASLHPEAPIAAPGSPVTFPGVDAALVIDHLGWLRDVIRQQAAPLIASMAGALESTDSGGVLSGKFLQPMGPAPMDFQPAFLLDDKNDRIIIATRPAYLAALLVKENKLVSQPEFEAAWKGLPTEGNGCLFASARSIQILTEKIKEGVATAATNPKESLMAGKVIDMLSKHVRGAQATCWANLPDGILTAANVSIPTANPGSISSITTLAILSSLAVPAFNSVQEKGTQMKSLNNGKQLLLALKQYASSHNGTYPPTLDVLQTEAIITDEGLLSCDGSPWLYDRTLTDSSPGISIVLAASVPTSKGGKKERLVIRNDGRAEVIPEDDFQRAKDFNLK